MLFSLGGSFLYYADRFKLYSAFCASHTKVPKVLVKGKAVRAGRRSAVADYGWGFLARNPRVPSGAGRCLATAGPWEMGRMSSSDGQFVGFLAVTILS